MAQNKRSVPASGGVVSKKLILEPKESFEAIRYDADVSTVQWWFPDDTMSYEERVLRERIKILDEQGSIDRYEELCEYRTQLAAIVLSK